MTDPPNPQQRGLVLTPEMMDAMDCDSMVVSQDPGGGITAQITNRDEVVGVVRISQAEYEDSDADLGRLIVERLIPKDEMIDGFRALLTELSESDLTGTSDPSTIEAPTTRSNDV